MIKIRDWGVDEKGNVIEPLFYCPNERKKYKLKYLLELSSVYYRENGPFFESFINMELFNGVIYFKGYRLPESCSSLIKEVNDNNSNKFSVDLMPLNKIDFELVINLKKQVLEYNGFTCFGDFEYINGLRDFSGHVFILNEVD